MKMEISREKVNYPFILFQLILVICLCLSFSTSAQADLFGYWPFEEGSGDVTEDLSPNATDGIIFNADTGGLGPGNSMWADDPERGSVLTFNGSSGYVHAGDTPLMTLDVDFTWSFWANQDSAQNTPANEIILGNRSQGPDFGRADFNPRQFIKFTPNRFEYHMNGGFVDDLPYGDPDLMHIQCCEWQHHAVVKEGNSLTYYRNGEELNSKTIVQDFSFPQPLFFGGEGAEYWRGSLDDVALWDEALTQERIQGIVDGDPILGPIEPFDIDGRGETYFQDFDIMGTSKKLPKGWSGEDTDGVGRRADSLGLVDGPLEGAVDSAAGVVNVGGNAERFAGDANFVATWQDDLDNDGALGEGDVIADAAVDRALGNARVNAGDAGSVSFEIEIGGNPLRAFVAEWDLEVWGGDPEAAFRGADGAGYDAELTVGGTSYYTESVSLHPGDAFNTSFDLAPGATHDPTLINGNEHAVRGNSSGIVEVTPADGAVGNLINFTFDANRAGDTHGWIQSVDNVLVRALAAGDAQADGDVDPADLIQLLAGGAFGQGNIDATWGQGDFDNDGDFDGTDILAVVQGLAGEFPKTYAHDPSNGVPDVLINPATGNITLDTNGTTIGSIVMDSAAGIFNGPNSPSWDAPGDFAADIDTQISMPISFTNPGYTGVDDLGDGIIGDLAPGFDILADLTIKYLDPNGDLLDAEAHVVPEPSSIVLAAFGVLGMLGYLRRRRRLG